MMAGVPSVENLGKKAMSGLPDQCRTPAFFHRGTAMQIIFPSTDMAAGLRNADYRAAADAPFADATLDASLP